MFRTTLIRKIERPSDETRNELTLSPTGERVGYLRLYHELYAPDVPRQARIHASVRNSFALWQILATTRISRLKLPKLKLRARHVTHPRDRNDPSPSLPIRGGQLFPLPSTLQRRSVCVLLEHFRTLKLEHSAGKSANKCYGRNGY